MRHFLSVLLALVISGCAGCNPREDVIPGQIEATALVWQFYGNTEPNSPEPPRIEWVYPEDLDCGLSEDGIYQGFYRRQVPIEKTLGIKPQCVAGVFWSEGYYTQVAHKIGFKFTTSAFAHELYHAHLWRSTGDGNGTHTDPGFKPGGAVDQANANLAAAGYADEQVEARHD